MRVYEAEDTVEQLAQRIGLSCKQQLEKKRLLLQMILGNDHLIGVDVNNDNKKAWSPFISS